MAEDVKYFVNSSIRMRNARDDQDERVSFLSAGKVTPRTIFGFMP